MSTLQRNTKQNDSWSDKPGHRGICGVTVVSQVMPPPASVHQICPPAQSGCGALLLLHSHARWSLWVLWKCRPVAKKSVALALTFGAASSRRVVTCSVDGASEALGDERVSTPTIVIFFLNSEWVIEKIHFFSFTTWLYRWLEHTNRVR